MSRQISAVFNKMKKTVAVFTAVLLLVCTFTSCKKNSTNDPSSEPTASSAYSEVSSEATQRNDIHPTVEPTESKAPLETESEKENQIVTYISESPDNKYICRVAEKYGSDKANLMAFIKTNSSTSGATVLEFSGKKDSNGNLIVTSDELRYVYDVPDNGTIKRASFDGKNNDGYNRLVAKIAISLAEKYFIPNIDEMREKRRYEDYFAD